MLRRVGDCEDATFIVRLSLSNSFVTCSLKRSLDISVPVASRALLPNCDLNSVWLRHLGSLLMGRNAAFPSSNGKSWNPHTMGHLTTQKT